MKARRLVGVVAVLGAVPASAGAAGVQDLDRVLFDRPYVEVLGASPAGVLYKASRDNNHALSQVATWVKPAGAPAYQVSTEFTSLAGDKIFGGTAYQYVGTPVTKRCDSSPPPARAMGAPGGLYASFGWISDAGYRVEAGPTGCQITTRYPGVAADTLIAMDDTGFVTVSAVNSDGDKQLTYRSYAEPAQPRVIADGGHTRYLGAVSLNGTAVAWSHLDYDRPDPQTSFVIRSSTDGSVAPKATRIPGWVISTAIAGAATGWTTCQQTEPCSTGSIAANGVQTSTTETRSLTSDRTRFVFDTLQPTPGIEASAAIGTTERTRLTAVDLLPPVARSVSVGAGGAAYVDSQLPADSVSRRLYNQSGALGPQVMLGHTVGRSMVSREGRRTAFVDNAGVLWLVTDDGVRTKVFTPVVRQAAVGGDQLRISGSRLLWWKGKYSGEQCLPGPTCAPLYENEVPTIYDLRTGVSTEQAIPNLQFRAVDLWGNYLTWADATNAIWRRDLSSGAAVQAKTAGTPRVVSLAVHDDWVAWATCQGTTTDGCGTSVIGHRNLQTKAPAIQLTSAWTETVRLSGGHVVYDVSAAQHATTSTVKVWRLGTSATGVVGAARRHASFDVHDETLVWVSPDELAKIGPNSPFVAYPKYLGNGSAPPSFNPALRRWNPEFGISKALPTCTLTIRSGTTVRRTLNCATTTGSARADWDGKDSAGRLLPPGAYSWTLAGRDGDGTLRWWTGATHAITGTVRIVS